ncbi:MAG: PilZ domain-containing protein [Ruminococcus sp.]|nr:PilZ domain-containing protein [Ruminococcus sp.]
MKLFDLFGKSAKREPKPAQEPEREISLEEHGVYSGMRVEAMDAENHLLFIAKLMSLSGDGAKLHPYSKAEVSFEEEMKIKIRGYSDMDKKVVHLEGNLKQADDGIWPVEGLIFIKSGNDRAFFRLNTDIDGSMVIIGKVGAGEEPCKLLNISVGGAYVRAEPALELGERFLLQVKLHPDRDMSLIYSEVCRIIEKEDEVFEYGCQFVELNEADQKQIIQAIYERQRKKKHGS